MYDYISENLQKLSGSLKIDDFTKQISNKMQKEYGVIIIDEWLDFANGYYQNHEGLESYGLPAEVAKYWSFMPINLILVNKQLNSCFFLLLNKTSIIIIH